MDRPPDCIGAGESDNGRLQCGCIACARRGAEILDGNSEGSRCKESIRGFLDLQGRREGKPHHAQCCRHTGGARFQACPIDIAAKKLSDASYPFIKSAPWDSDLYLKPLPGVSPNAAMKAIDKMIVMGASMDGKLLKEAAMAHSKALNSMDGKLVTDAANYEAVNAALGKVIASVPTSQVMDVYNAVGKVTGSSVPNNLFSMSSPSEATAAYDAFIQFKDVVKAAQR